MRIFILARSYAVALFIARHYEIKVSDWRYILHNELRGTTGAYVIAEDGWSTGRTRAQIDEILYHTRYGKAKVAHINTDDLGRRK